MRYKLVLLDRDGVINYVAKDNGYVYEESQFVIYDDVSYFVRELIKTGTKIAIVTNQRGISLGLYTEREVQNLHRILLKHCEIEDNQMKLFFCPHNLNECECRKPKSGLLRLAIESESLSFSDALFIGDQETDGLAALDLQIDFIKLNRGADSSNTRSLKDILDLMRLG